MRVFTVCPLSRFFGTEEKEKKKGRIDDKKFCLFVCLICRAFRKLLLGHRREEIFES